MRRSNTRGGARRGAGRKPSPDRLIRIDARLSKSQIEYLKSIDTNVSKAIRTVTDQRSKMDAELRTFAIQTKTAKQAQNTVKAYKLTGVEFSDEDDTIFQADVTPEQLKWLQEDLEVVYLSEI